jgi:hypothetical protein
MALADSRRFYCESGRWHKAERGRRALLLRRRGPTVKAGLARLPFSLTRRAAPKVGSLTIARDMLEVARHGAKDLS